MTAFSGNKCIWETIDSLLMVQKYMALREMLPSFAPTSCFPFLDSTKNVRGKEWKAKLAGRLSFHYLLILHNQSTVSLGPLKNEYRPFETNKDP